MTHHRSWFPTILIGLTIGLGAIFYALDRKEENDLGPAASNDGDGAAEEIVVPATSEGYQAAVTALMQSYATDKNAEATYNGLIVLRVPTDLQQLHLDLVIAFSQLAAGNRDDGAARLEVLKAQYSWLPL